MSLTVHHLQNSQSERIPWLCEELNIPYDLKLYQRSPLLCPDDLASLSAMQAAPVITDTTVVSVDTEPNRMSQLLILSLIGTSRHPCRIPGDNRIHHPSPR